MSAQKVPSHLPELPIYQKAKDIFVLSHNISTYLRDDLMLLDRDGNESEYIYFSGDIVQQSHSLAPHILKAELEVFQENRHKHVTSVRKLTNRLYRNCIRLEKSNSNGKDYLKVLKSELKKFNKLQKNWALTL